MKYRYTRTENFGIFTRAENGIKIYEISTKIDLIAS